MGEKKVFLSFAVIFALLACSPQQPSNLTETRNWIGERTYPSNQPVPYQWYGNLEKLMNWTPEADPDRDYNRGTIPLKKKFTNKDYFVNKNAKDIGFVSIVSPWWPSENQPSYISQGSEYFEIQTYTWWQYNDIYIMFNNWHTLPSVEMIDAAHRNGVRVYSLIMDPSPKDVKALLKKEGNRFPGADKLIEIAEYYKFDGWFLNFEKDGNEFLSESLRDFLIYFNEKGKEKNIYVMMYDSWIENGKVKYQNELNKRNLWFFDYNGKPAANEFFVNYWYKEKELEETGKLVRDLQRDPMDIHFGFETWRNYWNRGEDLADPYLVEKVPHRFSLSLFQMNGAMDISSDYKDYYKLTERFYSGRNYDPSNTESEKRWKGVAHYYPAKSVIDEIPFVTNFCTSNGKFFMVNGKKLKKTGWNNRAVQDLLPTWRWIVEADGEKLVPELDFSDAYYGGNCLKVSGNLIQSNFIRLFMTNLEIASNTKLNLVLKTGKEKSQSNMKLALSFTDNPKEWVYLDVGKLLSVDWNRKFIDLSKYKGKTVGSIGLYFDSEKPVQNYEILIGRLGIIESNGNPPEAPSNLVIESKVEDKTNIASLRLKWDKSSSETHSYNVYKEQKDGSMLFLGSSSTNAYFAAMCPRDGSEKEGRIFVEAVDKEFRFSEKKAFAKFKWETVDVPEKTELPNPMSKSENVGLKPVLSWLKTKGASSYDLYFGNKDSMAFTGNFSDTKFEIEKLETGKEYFWRVDPRNTFGSTKGETWSFKTITDSNEPEAVLKSFDKIEVNGENSAAGEVKENLFDSDFSTKWLDFSSRSWIKVKFPEEIPERITKYIITSANDTPSRDPGEWKLSGSNDGKNWKVLDIREDEKFTERNQTREFYFVNPEKYIYYKMELESRSGTILQIGELDFVKSR